MRILWITPGFAADEHDDNCIPPLQFLAAELIRRGVDLHIVALEYPFRPEPYRWGAAAVYPCDGRNRLWLRLRTLARARAFAQQVFFEKKCDALHSFWLGPAWALGEQIFRRLHVPHHTTLMGQDVLPNNRYLRRLSAESARRLVALTPFQRAALEQSTGFLPGCTIPWGLPAAEYAAPPGAGPRSIDVLGAGSLLPVKDWPRWLHVLRRVADARPGLRAELIGDGPERPALQRLAKRLGLTGHVHFAGEMPRPAVLERMRAARVLLHTARFEGFGMVLIEAAAAGCAVVRTPAGVAVGHCAETEEGLAEGVLACLQGGAGGAPRFSIADTAEAYLKLT